MHQMRFVHYALSICAAAAILAGCGGSPPPIGAAGGAPQGYASARHGRLEPLLYVGNISGYNDIKVYPADDRNPSPIAVISDGLDGPTGDCIDSDGTLYVVNEGAGLGWVTEFAAGQTKPSKVISKGINTPAFCAIDSSGNLWVTNIGGPNVTEYEKGSTKPHTTITKGMIYPDGIAIDQSGNMYVANHVTGVSRAATFGPGNVVVYSPGAKSPGRTITDDVVSPVGITVDAAGTLYVTNEGQNNVQEYRFGKSQPYQTITQDMVTPTAVTVDKKGYLYITDHGNSVVVEFAPGSIKSSRREISKGLFEPAGTAYSPPLLPKN